MAAPGFWDDQQQAARISTEQARVTRRLERYRRLSQEYEDAAELASMDGDMAGEIAASLAPLRAEPDYQALIAELRGIRDHYRQVFEELRNSISSY